MTDRTFSLAATADGRVEMPSDVRRILPMGVRKAGGALLLLSTLLACGSSTSDGDAMPLLSNDSTVRVVSQEHVDVDIRTNGPVRVGKNDVFVSFPAHNAELASVSTLMPAMGHGGPTPVIERDGDVFVVRDLVLFMSGRWELHLELRGTSQEDEAIVAVDVP